ncbi:MAG TPA: glycosyltransferase family 10 [Rhabdochlamydiaceae bacterium]|nr:glycosyltransferase family 10 [Rhabdochlamydiaceae bacterium]
MIRSAVRCISKFLIFVFPLVSEAAPNRIDVISGFRIFDMPITLESTKNKGFSIQNLYPFDYEKIVVPDDPQIRKIIFINCILENIAIFQRLPQEKMVYFLMEPFKLKDDFYSYFSRVYTWDDELVDNVKFFKLYYPYLIPMRQEIPSFENKKFCVMVAGSEGIVNRENELYSERVRMAEFFETKPVGEFDIYGWAWDRNRWKNYRGHIPGNHSGKQKISTLSNYRFCICFENTKNIFGYISEKIFSCFAAGCVPVYWGAENIERYIPKSCFIDYRDFLDQEKLYHFLKSMPEAVYNEYITNIRKFLESSESQVFSPEYFNRMFYEAVQ